MLKSINDVLTLAKSVCTFCNGSTAAGHKLWRERPMIKYIALWLEKEPNQRTGKDMNWELGKGTPICAFFPIVAMGFVVTAKPRQAIYEDALSKSKFMISKSLQNGKVKFRLTGKKQRKG
jgi:hypothetical protein